MCCINVDKYPGNSIRRRNRSYIFCNYFCEKEIIASVFLLVFLCSWRCDWIHWFEMHIQCTHIIRNKVKWTHTRDTPSESNHVAFNKLWLLTHTHAIRRRTVRRSEQRNRSVSVVISCFLHIFCVVDAFMYWFTKWNGNWQMKITASRDNFPST